MSTHTQIYKCRCGCDLVLVCERGVIAFISVFLILENNINNILESYLIA